MTAPDGGRGGAGERLAQLSVLDRLVERPVDDEPHARDWAASVRQLKALVRRDLEWLLNTRRPPLAAMGGAPPEVRRSLWAYGLPDLTSLSADAPEDRAELLRAVQEAVDRFEPRLADVTVEILAGRASHDRDVRLRIAGLLRLDPSPERVVFDTRREAAGGDFRVGEAQGG